MRKVRINLSSSARSIGYNTWLDIRRLRQEPADQPHALAVTPVVTQVAARVDPVLASPTGRPFCRRVQKSRLAIPIQVFTEQEIVELKNSTDYECLLPAVEAGLLITHRLQNVRSIAPYFVNN